MVVSQRGRKIHVSLQWLRTELIDAAKLSGAARLRKITKLLDRLSAQQKVAMSIPDIAGISISRSRAALKDVLSRREYSPSRQELFWQEITGFFFSLLDRLNIPRVVGDVISWCLMALVAVVLVATLAYLVWRLASLGKPEPKSRRDKVNTSNSIISQSAVLEAAERDAAGGNYREAFRGVYLAAILALDRAKLVKYVDGMTNWEYMNTLMRGESKGAANKFKPMTVSFDELIYGKQHISERDYNECRARYNALEEML